SHRASTRLSGIAAWQHAIGNQAMQRLLTGPAVQRTIWGWEGGQWKTVVPTSHRNPPTVPGSDGDFWDDESNRHLSRADAEQRYCQSYNDQLKEGARETTAEASEMEVEGTAPTAQTTVPVLGPTATPAVPFVPRINSYFWSHILGVHSGSGIASGKSE